MVYHCLVVYHCHKKVYYQINSILSNLFYLAMNFFLILLYSLSLSFAAISI